MQKSITTFIFLLFFTLTVISQTKKGKSSSSTSVKKNTTTTSKVKVLDNGNATKIDVKNNQPVDVKVTQTFILSFDSLVENMKSSVDVSKLTGNWAYEHTFVVENGKGREFARTYTTGLGKSGVKTDKVTIISNSTNLPTSAANATMNFQQELERQERELAQKLGRDPNNRNELLLLLDPSFTYKFWQNNNIIQFTIQRMITEKKIEIISTHYVVTTVTQNSKNNKYYLNFDAPNDGLKKSWRLLYLDGSQLILVDEQYKELYYFKQKG